jgi:hypothetical protein
VQTSVVVAAADPIAIAAKRLVLKRMVVAVMVVMVLKGRLRLREVSSCMK